MPKSVVQTMLEKQLDSVTTRLENSLKDLLHRTRTSLEALQKGGQLDPLVMKTHVDIDSLASDYNRIREVLAMLDMASAVEK